MNIGACCGRGNGEHIRARGDRGHQNSPSEPTKHRPYELKEAEAACTGSSQVPGPLRTSHPNHNILLSGPRGPVAISQSRICAPASKPPDFYSHNSDSKSKLLSETQSNLLIITPGETKKQIMYFQHEMAQKIHYRSKREDWGS